MVVVPSANTIKYCISVQAKHAGAGSHVHCLWRSRLLPLARQDSERPVGNCSCKLDGGVSVFSINDNEMSSACSDDVCMRSY